MTLDALHPETGIAAGEPSPGIVLSPAPAPLPQARTFAEQTFRAIFRGWAARLGAAWIGLLAFAAVFAPFLANSYPYLLRDAAGRWQCPLLQSLTWLDITLPAMLIAGLVAWRVPRLRNVHRIWILALALALVAGPAWYFRHPPELGIYGRYREARSAGLITNVVHAPLPFSPSDRLFDLRLAAPSAAHPLGTDVNGTDVLSAMLHACRTALSIGLVSTGISVVIGIILGGVMGYFAGAADILGMRLIEIFEAIPSLFLMITIVAFFPSEHYRLLMLMAVIGVTSWTGFARFVRADFLSLRQQDFVHAARAAGLPLRSILFRHMLPNGITAVLISAMFGIGGAVAGESTLSFLNLGVIDQPDWGNLLSQATGAGGNFVWWMAIFPGLAIFLTVLAYTLIGEAVRDALDPRQEKV